MGAVSESPDLTRMRSSGHLSTSATHWASMVSDPWPISAAIECTVMPPSMSIFRCTVDWGSSLRWIRWAEPEM